MENGSPIACRLSSPDLAARFAEIRSGLLASVREVENIEAGYRLRWPNTEETAEAVLDFVRFERQCCPFLDFQVTLPAAARPIALELTGDREVQEFIRVAFVKNVTSGIALS